MQIGQKEQLKPIWHALDGGCMRPLLWKDEILPVHPVDPDNVSSGDIVLYRVGEKKMLHRVWSQDDRSFWIKDDTGTVDLHRIPRRYVLGRLDIRGPLNRGRLGLVYSWINTVLFLSARFLKNLGRFTSVNG